MKATITVEMNNAAFDPDPEQELARILQELVHRLLNDGAEICAQGGKHPLRDVNGNKVGKLFVG